MEFSKLEGCPLGSEYASVDTFAEMNKCKQRLSLSDRLLAMRVATKILTEHHGRWPGYFILLLDIEKKSIEVTHYNKNQLLEATDFYNRQEENYKGHANKDLVLVSAESVQELIKAYPNYSLDLNEFQQNLNRVDNVYNGNN